MKSIRMQINKKHWLKVNKKIQTNKIILRELSMKSETIFCVPYFKL